MSVLALDLALVRDVLLPGVSLSPGRGMMARVVAADEGDGGTLAIAGYLLDAELPAELAAGQSLRLVVRDVTADRALLAVAPQDAPPATVPVPQPQTQPLAAPIPLPGGAQLRVLGDGGDDQGAGGRGGGSGGGHALGLALDLPGLGPLELRFGLDPASVRAAISTDPGAALERAQGRAGELRDALARVCERPATVTVSARRRPFDTYA